MTHIKHKYRSSTEVSKVFINNTCAENLKVATREWYLKQNNKPSIAIRRGKRISMLRLDKLPHFPLVHLHAFFSGGLLLKFRYMAPRKA